MKKIVRNRVRTTEHIVDTLEQLLNEEGIDVVSINRIAEKANVSKVLIYRYFGGIEGLLEYYVKRGQLFPDYTPAIVDQIRPLFATDLAKVWSSQSLLIFRQLRRSRADRELLKVTLKEDNPLSIPVSKARDEELTRLVNQLVFVKGCDYKAFSAVVLGGLSFLTVQAQNDRPMIGIDVRSNEGWERIEEAVKVICKAINQFAIDSPDVQIATKSTSLGASNW